MHRDSCYSPILIFQKNMTTADSDGSKPKPFKCPNNLPTLEPKGDGSYRNLLTPDKLQWCGFALIVFQQRSITFPRRLMMESNGLACVWQPERAGTVVTL